MWCMGIATPQAIGVRMIGVSPPQGEGLVVDGREMHPLCSWAVGFVHAGHACGGAHVMLCQCNRLRRDLQRGQESDLELGAAPLSRQGTSL